MAREGSGQNGMQATEETHQSDVVRSNSCVVSSVAAGLEISRQGKAVLAVCRHMLGAVAEKLRTLCFFINLKSSARSGPENQHSVETNINQC